jgi:flagellar hook-associated protein 2
MSTLGEENQMASVSATSTPTIGVGSDGKVTAGNLVANLDTKAIVDALMTAASIPKVQLEGRIKVEQTRVSMYQSLNTGLQTLQTTTDGYTAANAMNLLSVKSSDSSITATTTTSEEAGVRHRSGRRVHRHEVHPGGLIRQAD